MQRAHILSMAHVWLPRFDQQFHRQGLLSWKRLPPAYYCLPATLGITCSAGAQRWRFPSLLDFVRWSQLMCQHATLLCEGDARCFGLPINKVRWLNLRARRQIVLLTKLWNVLQLCLFPSGSDMSIAKDFVDTGKSDDMWSLRVWRFEFHFHVQRDIVYQFTYCKPDFSVQRRQHHVPIESGLLYFLHGNTLLQECSYHLPGRPQLLHILSWWLRMWG